MRVSDSHRAVFVHVPKTGGSTVDHLFDTELTDARRVLKRARHATYRRLLKQEPELGDYWSCGFVRNPWARMVSWWSMGNDVFARAAEGRPKAMRNVEKTHIWGRFEGYRDDFHKFVMEAPEEWPRFGQPQVTWLLRPDKTLVDFVGKVENFVADVNVVRERLGLEPVPEQPRRNASSHGHYSDYYDDKTRQRVAELFARDIEAFDYTF
jgi:Sulfotransferase family